MKRCPFMVSRLEGYKKSDYANRRDKVMFEKCYEGECMAYKDGKCALLENNVKPEVRDETD